MPLNWIDAASLSFNNLLLLERVQISWFPGWVADKELAIALAGNPTVEWFLRHKCPEVRDWLDQVCAKVLHPERLTPERVREAEIAVMARINDLMVYAVDPAIYDGLAFLGWDSNELTSLVNFSGATAVDVGSGTGRLALVAAEKAKSVFAVEPVGNLRRYLKEKARSLGFTNVFPIDGVITEIPLPDGFGDVVMGGHVFGDRREPELAELRRVTRPSGMVILCPGNVDRDNETHEFLVANGLEWSRFEEPGDGWKRKYWQRV